MNKAGGGDCVGNNSLFLMRKVRTLTNEECLGKPGRSNSMESVAEKKTAFEKK